MIYFLVMVIEALADLVVSEALIAVTENVAGEGTPFGAL
jgi:hypothetical protein